LFLFFKKEILPSLLLPRPQPVARMKMDALQWINRARHGDIGRRRDWPRQDRAPGWD
jgi:hypothetical protein